MNKAQEITTTCTNGKKKKEKKSKKKPDQKQEEEDKNAMRAEAGTVGGEPDPGGIINKGSRRIGSRDRKQTGRAAGSAAGWSRTRR